MHEYGLSASEQVRRGAAHGGKLMSFYRGMTCENLTIIGDEGTPITAYVAKPSGSGPFPGVVLIHHLPGWSEFYIETTRRFAHHGYSRSAPISMSVRARATRTT